MTISSTVTDKTATANGSTTQFPFPNKIFSAADLVVLLTDLAGNTYAFTGGPTTFTNAATGLSYTVQNVDVDTGCTVVFSAAPTNGWTVDIRSAIAEVQSTSIKNQGNFLPELHEEFFDRATRMLQDLLRITYTYGIHGPDTETTPWPALPNAAGRANLALIFSGAGLPTVGTPISQTLAVSQIQFYGTDSGTANAYVVAVTSPSVAFALTAGVLVRFTALNADTGASTLNVAGSGAQPLIGQTGATLTGGEILTTGPTWVQWTGSAWQIVGTGVQPANVRTAAEIAGGVTPANYAIPSHNAIGVALVDRYATNTTPGTTDMSVGLQRAINVALAANGSGLQGIPVRFLSGAYLIDTPPTFGSTGNNGLSLDIGGCGTSTQLINGAAAGNPLFNFTGYTDWYLHDLLICGSTANDAVHVVGGLNVQWRIERVMSLAPGYGFYLSNTNTGTIRDCSHWPTTRPLLIVPQTVTATNINHGVYGTGSYVHNVSIYDFNGQPSTSYASGQCGINFAPSASYGLNIVGGVFEGQSGTNAETAISLTNCFSACVQGVYHENAKIALIGCVNTKLDCVENGGAGGGIALTSNSLNNTLVGCFEGGSSPGALSFDSTSYGNTVIGSYFVTVTDNATAPGVAPNVFINSVDPDRGATVGAADSYTRVTATGGGTVSIDMKAFEFYDINVGTGGTFNFTIANPTNLVPGRKLSILLRNSAGTAWTGTLTWGSAYRVAAFTSLASATQRVYSFQYDSASATLRQMAASVDVAT